MFTDMCLHVVVCTCIYVREFVCVSFAFTLLGILFLVKYRREPNITSFHQFLFLLSSSKC